MGHKIPYLSSLLVTCHQSSRLYGVMHKKASGSDGLNAIVLKECSNGISSILTVIFNDSLGRDDVPDDW